MKFLTLILFALIVLLQYPLWFSKSSWKRVWLVEEEVSAARQNNVALQHRNNMLEAELSDLKLKGKKYSYDLRKSRGKGDP